MPQKVKARLIVIRRFLLCIQAALLVGSATDWTGVEAVSPPPDRRWGKIGAAHVRGEVRVHVEASIKEDTTETFCTEKCLTGLIAFQETVRNGKTVSRNPSGALRR